MKFSFEVPVNYLRKFDKINDYHFILAHLLENKEYYNFYKRSQKFKILDNSAAELKTSVSHYLLLEKAYSIKTNVLIVPDCWMNYKKTIKLTKQFIRFLRRSGWKKEHFKLMAVPQGETSTEWKRCFLRFVRLDEVDYIGLPYLTIARCFAGYSPYGRDDDVTFTRITVLINTINFVRKYNKKIHLLGLGFNGGIEIGFASQFKEVESLDTSTPFVLAQKNKIIRTREFPRIIKSAGSLRFDAKFDNRILKLTLHNAKQLKQFSINY